MGVGMHGLGYPQVAKLFRAAAAAETVHAHAHLRTGGGIKTTAENLKAAIAGEIHEFEHMYPEMIAAAQAEANKGAERSFSYANEGEKIHAGLYQKALANLDKKSASGDYYVCSVCGYTCEDHPPEKGPVCNSGAKALSKVG